MLTLADARRFGVSRGSTMAQVSIANIMTALMDETPVDASTWHRLMIESARAADEMMERLLPPSSSLAWLDVELYEASLRLDADALSVETVREEGVA